MTPNPDTIARIVAERAVETGDDVLLALVEHHQLLVTLEPADEPGLYAVTLADRVTGQALGGFFATAEALA